MAAPFAHRPAGPVTNRPRSTIGRGAASAPTACDGVDRVSRRRLRPGRAGPRRAKRRASGVATVVLERDPVVGAKRVCAAGLRPGFCETSICRASIVHCDPPTIDALGPTGRPTRSTSGTAHTTTREELDGTIAALARAEGARDPHARALPRLERDGDGRSSSTPTSRAASARRSARKRVFLAQGSSARSTRRSALRLRRRGAPGSSRAFSTASTSSGRRSTETYADARDALLRRPNPAET